MGWWLKQEIHTSWRIAIVAALFVGGVAASLLISVPGWVGAILIIPLIIALFIRYVYGIPLLVVGATYVGLAYGSLHLSGRSQYQVFVGSIVTVRGKVKEDISQGSSGSLSIQLHKVTINSVSLPGTILATGRSSGGALRGDIMEFQGKVQNGFGSFPASIMINKIIVVERQPLGDVGRVVRDWFASMVRKVINEPQASLGIGFLTGQKSALPTNLAEALKIAGLTHIVVASGYNLTILVRLARRLLLKVSKYLSAVSSAAMIVAFVAVTGLSPSMTRAGLVSGLSLMAWYYGNAFHPLVLLPVAAAITVAVQPSYVWGDMGWQLSFTAFLGVMIVAPLIQAYFFGNKQPGVLRQILGETVAAHLVTVPIIAISFGTVSNVAIIANLLVVPLVPLAMLLTFICGVGAILAVPFIGIIATPTSWLLGYMVNVANFVAEIPWAQSTLAVQPIMWAFYAVLLVITCLWMWRKTKYSFRENQALLY